METDTQTVLDDMYNTVKVNNAMDRLRKYSAVDYGAMVTVFPQNDYVTYSKLSSVGKRKMLRKMEAKIALKDMTYAQAKLFHRLKGRIG
jgi:hypothetical protein